MYKYIKTFDHQCSQGWTTICHKAGRIRLPTPNTLPTLYNNQDQPYSSLKAWTDGRRQKTIYKEVDIDVECWLYYKLSFWVFSSDKLKWKHCIYHLYLHKSFKLWNNMNFVIVCILSGKSLLESSAELIPLIPKPYFWICIYQFQTDMFHLKFLIFGWWRFPFYFLRGLHFSTCSVC